MVRRIILLGFALAFIAPAVGEAQSADERFRAQYGHNCCQNWAEFEYYCETLQGGTAEPNPARCVGGSGGGGGGGGTNRVFLVPTSPPVALAQSIVLGAAGCALGSLAPNANEGDDGHCAAGGYGTMAVAAVAARLGNKNWSGPAKLVVASAGCAAAGAAVASYQQRQALDGSLEQDEAKKNVAKYAGYGAAGCGAAEVLRRLVPDSELRLFRAVGTLLRPGERVALLQRGNQLGANIEW